jgi:hypothetical protein
LSESKFKKRKTFEVNVMKNMIKIIFIVGTLSLLISLPVYADFVWPALYLVQRSVIWWVILPGLIVEFFFVKMLTKSDIKKSILINIVMNLCSSLLGLFLIPIAGIAWEVFPGLILYKIFDIGTFNPGTWTATCLFAIVINAFIEKLAIEKIFNYKIGKKGFWWLALANSLSVGLAFVSMFYIHQQL